MPPPVGHNLNHQSAAFGGMPGNGVAGGNGAAIPVAPPPLPPSVIYNQYNNQKQTGQLGYPGLYKKPSPPGSVASHKSSSNPSSHSPASSITNFKPNNGNISGMMGNGAGAGVYSPHSPTTQNNINMLNSYNKLQQQPQQHPPDLYIPENSRTSDI